MPDNKRKKNPPLPSKGYNLFKQQFDEPSSNLEGKTKQQELNEKAELLYYSKKLNEELRKKDPKNFDSLIKEYGYNEQNPLYPQERIKGAEKYIRGEEGKSFNKALAVEEQRKLLGKSWDRYVQLKKIYGQGLNLMGENEDPNKPETWQIGARHAVSLNPYASISSAIRDKNTKAILGDYARYVAYDPTQKNPYVTTDVSNIEEQPQYVRTIKRMYPQYDSSTTKVTASGNTWKDPGMAYVIEYTDGYKETTNNEDEYLNYLGYKNAPANIKKAALTKKVDISTLTPEEQEARIRALSKQNLAEEL